jgi:hypothetical protein
MKAIKPGLRLKSAVCSSEIIVIRGSLPAADLRCGGARMIAAGDAMSGAGQLDPAYATGTLIGKRYIDAADRIEILCTKAGEGSLTLDGEPLVVKQAKALPSSD